MYILNIFENGVEGIKLNYPQKSTENIRKIIFLNNIVANKTSKKDRLNYLKYLNRMGLTFYFVTEKDVQNINKNKWHELYNTLNNKDKKILSRILHFTKYSRSKKNKTNKHNKTKKMNKKN
jgi:hypothetical protein